MTTTAALELVQLTKKYGAVTAVDAINLKIPAGSLLLPAWAVRLRQNIHIAHGGRP